MSKILNPKFPSSNVSRLTVLLHGTPKQQAEARIGDNLSIGALGSGSDFSAFIDHVGIATVNLGFAGEDPSGNYHSIYDDFYWYSHFSDYDFVYGRALAQAAGLSCPAHGRCRYHALRI